MNLPLDYAVFDVRDNDEYASGRIRGAKNLPSSQWNDETFVNKVVEEYKTKDNIFVTCFKSQHRGPTCASKLADGFQKYLEEHPEEKLPTLYDISFSSFSLLLLSLYSLRKVISGGVCQFQARYENNSELYER